MWWLLVVVLWSGNADEKPQVLVPIATPSAAICHKAAVALLSDIASDHLATVAAVTSDCVPTSNPLTEKHS